MSVVIVNICTANRAHRSICLIDRTLTLWVCRITNNHFECILLFVSIVGSNRCILWVIASLSFQYPLVAKCILHCILSIVSNILVCVVYHLHYCVQQSIARRIAPLCSLYLSCVLLVPSGGMSIAHRDVYLVINSIILIVWWNTSTRVLWLGQHRLDSAHKSTHSIRALGNVLVLFNYMQFDISFRFVVSLFNLYVRLGSFRCCVGVVLCVSSFDLFRSTSSSSCTRSTPEYDWMWE